MTIPVTILTGFLGSGKTTILNRLLRHPEFRDTAVIVNEFGDVGLDHLLIEHGDEGVILLESGCVCCSLRSGLADSLRRMIARRRKGEVPPFRRIVVETTGVADPLPILQMFVADRGLGKSIRLDGVVTTVDAATATDTFGQYEQSVRQAAVADRILVTKCDLAPVDALARVERELDAINPAAPRRHVAAGRIEPSFLFDLLSPRSLEAGSWLAPAGHAAHVNSHSLNSFAIMRGTPLQAEALDAWLEALLAPSGGNVLRLKGIVNLVGYDKPIVIHGVQHLVHAPVVLERWPSSDRSSRIVLITRGIDPTFVEDTLLVLDAGNPDDARITWPTASVRSS